MRSFAILLSCCAGLLPAQPPADWQSWLQRGVQAFKNAQYADAAVEFQRAADLNPSNPTARLYLGTTYMQQYIPCAESADNREMWERAAAEFMRVLDMDPKNRTAVESLGSLYLAAKKWDDARDWYLRQLSIRMTPITRWDLSPGPSGIRHTAWRGSGVACDPTNRDPFATRKRARSSGASGAGDRGWHLEPDARARHQPEVR